MHLVKNNYVNTLNEAAESLGVTEELLKDDACTNIKGGAVLLKKYFEEAQGKNEWERWFNAAKKILWINKR